MNQILVSEKVYVTPTLKKKKRFYKIQFVLSLLALIVLISYVVCDDISERKKSNEAKNILDDFANIDTTVADEDTLIVALNDNAEEIQEEPKVLDQFNTVYKTDSGMEYRVDSILNIPSLDINYPVLNDSNNELLKISLNKFWGGEPNAVGNYCIVGHNYDGKDIFFGKLNRIKNGDIVELKDKTGKTLNYQVYNKFIVQPTDVACTSQLTNGKTEMTLITCANGGKTRLIVKCRAEE